MPLLEENIYKFRDAIDRMGAFASVTSDLKFMTVSSSFTGILGYTEADLAGTSIHDLSVFEPGSMQHMQMVRHLYSGGTWIGDIICRHKDGSCLEARLSIAPSIEDGVILGFIAQYQKSFVEHGTFDMADVLHRYRSGFNKIAGMAIVTSTGEIQEVNDLFVDMFGYSRSEIVGAHIDLLSRQTGSAEMPSHIWDVVKTGQVYTGEVEGFRHDGQSIYARVTVSPASEVSSDVIASFDAYLVIYQDITKETEMRNNQNELAVEAAKQQMLNGAIHNISNLQQGVIAANSKTMNAAQGLDDACRQAQVHYQSLTSRDDQSTFLTAMSAIVRVTVTQIVESVQEERRAIDETVAIVNSFRREQRNIRLVTDESISAFVQRILNTFSLQAARHNIAVCISSMTDLAVRWPTAQVHQIIFNLLINAQQAITEQVEAGHLPAHRGRIELAIEHVDNDVLFYVRDNGGGFHVPVQQLFTPRFTTKLAGSGIGLHTSAIMAQNMGGSLSAENTTVNKQPGAQFMLRIPSSIEAKGAV